MMGVCQMVPLKKRVTGDACSPLHSGGRPNTYGRKGYKAGSYVQENLLESSGLLIDP
jgi:hypothetical protein